MKTACVCLISILPINKRNILPICRFTECHMQRVVPLVKRVMVKPQNKRIIRLIIKSQTSYTSIQSYRLRVSNFPIGRRQSRLRRCLDIRPAVVRECRTVERDVDGIGRIGSYRHNLRISQCPAGTGYSPVAFRGQVNGRTAARSDGRVILSL